MEHLERLHIFKAFSNKIWTEKQRMEVSQRKGEFDAGGVREATGVAPYENAAPHHALPSLKLKVNKRHSIGRSKENNQCKQA